MKKKIPVMFLVLIALFFCYWGFEKNKVKTICVAFNNAGIPFIEGDPNKKLREIVENGHNIVFDFPNKQIQISRRSISIPESWIEIPFLCNGKEVALDVDTDFGKKRLILQTTCTCSSFPVGAIHQSKIIKASQEWGGFETCYLENLLFGGSSHGSLRFILSSYELPENFDGVLGMDFLRKNRIYIDFQKNKAWIEPKAYEETIFSIKKYEPDFLVFQSDINKKSGLFLLDLGFDCLINFRNGFFDKPSFFEKNESFSMVLGSEMILPKYSSKLLEIGYLAIKDFCFFTELEKTFFSVANRDFQSISALIGCEILNYTNLFLDFKNKQIRMVNSVQKLLEKELISPKCLKIPYEGGHKIYIMIETELGRKKVFIDTGSSCSYFICTKEQKESEYNGYTISSSIKIGDRVFPECDFKITAQDKPFCEGVLGMDFLAKHQIYIDSENHMIWID